MKSIEFIVEAEKMMTKIGIPANIKIGTIELKASGSLINWAGKEGEYKVSEVTFNLNFLTTQIQRLLDLGVKINFQTVVTDNNETVKATKHATGREAIKMGRYQEYINQYTGRKTAVIENWLNATASCSVRVLEMLDKYVRENHRNEIAIHNDFVTGWGKNKTSAYVKSSAMMFFAKEIRKNIADKKKKYSELLPIEKRALVK